MAFSQFEITGRRKVFKGNNIKTARGIVDLEKKLENLSKSAALKFCVGHGAMERVVDECTALLEGQAQQDYYRASADKVRAEIENLPLEQKFDILDNITETLKQAREGEIELTDERKLELNQASQLLTSQILALQGITANSLTGFNVNEALGPKIN